jgi:Ner family transcriptional regulator
MSPAPGRAELVPLTWDRHAIKAEIGRRGLTLIGISQAAGLCPSACGIALVRRFPSAEAAIAAALGIAPDILWPERCARRSPSAPLPRKRGRESRAARREGAVLTDQPAQPSADGPAPSSPNASGV